MQGTHTWTGTVHSNGLLRNLSDRTNVRAVVKGTGPLFPPLVLQAQIKRRRGSTRTVQQEQTAKPAKKSKSQPGGRMVAGGREGGKAHIKAKGKVPHPRASDNARQPVASQPALWRPPGRRPLRPNTQLSDYVER